MTRDEFNYLYSLTSESLGQLMDSIGMPKQFRYSQESPPIEQVNQLIRWVQGDLTRLDALKHRIHNQTQEPHPTMLLPDSELIVQVDKDTLFRLLYNNLIYDCLSFEEAAEIYGLTLNKFKVEYMKAAFDNFVIDFYNIFPLDVFEEEMTFLLSYYSTDEDTNTALNEILPEFYDAMIMGDLDAFYQKHSFIYEVEDETEISDN